VFVSIEGKAMPSLRMSRALVLWLSLSCFDSCVNNLLNLAVELSIFCFRSGVVPTWIKKAIGSISLIDSSKFRLLKPVLTCVLAET